MAIEAPLSKYKKTNLKIYIVVLLAVSIWFGYDGYINKDFIAKYTDENGVADSTLLFNQRAPFVMVPLALAMVGYFFAVKGKKIIADDEAVTLGKTKVAYDSIEKIDKTRFETKGNFVVTYKDASGAEKQLKFTEKNYDNLSAVLEQVIKKIS